MDTTTEQTTHGIWNAAGMQPLTPGQYYPEHGGVFAGLYIQQDGHAYGLIVARQGDYEAIRGEWGQLGADVDAGSHDDGLMNTIAMAECSDDDNIADRTLALRIGGFEDWHIPSRLQALLAFHNAREQLPRSWIWTSTQLDAHNAWCQRSNGCQGWSSKLSEGAVVPVRRFLVI